MLTEFKKDLTEKTGRQISTLYLSQIIALFLAIFTGIINTRVLGPVGYGSLAFFNLLSAFYN
jgi:O-antigen/teichoic acid export membrane protein